MSTPTNPEAAAESSDLVSEDAAASPPETADSLDIGSIPERSAVTEDADSAESSAPLAALAAEESKHSKAAAEGSGSSAESQALADTQADNEADAEADQETDANEAPTATAADSENAENADNEPSLAELRKVDGATIALVAGQAVTELPKDLYIPPEALEVFLETFEGPLDLLLYLIRRQNLDILDVSVSEITAQYMGYIDLMTALQLELVGEYLVMAAMLAEIKSRMLLPRPESVVEDEEDPRAELIRRLQQYERFKTAAENIDALPRLDRDIAVARAERPTLVRERAEPDVDLREMLVALGQVLRKADMFKKHAVQFEPLTVRERMSDILVKVQDNTEFVSFIGLFNPREGRGGVVVTFLAILELVREHMLDFVQNEPFAPLYVRPAVGETQASSDEPTESTGEIEDPFVIADFKVPVKAPEEKKDASDEVMDAIASMLAGDAPGAEPLAAEQPDGQAAEQADAQVDEATASSSADESHTVETPSNDQNPAE